MRHRAHLHNEQEDACTTGGTTTSDSLPTSMVVLSALAPKDRVFDGAMSLPSVEHHFGRALGELASSKRSCFARRKGWRHSTGSSVPLGGAVAPERTKRAAAPSRGTELGLQTYRSSVACTASGGLSLPQFQWCPKVDLACKTANHFVFSFFSSLPCCQRQEL